MAGENWQKIKTAYIRGNDTLKELAEKKHVSYSMIQKRSSEEKWAAAREDFRRRAEEKALARAQARAVERLDKAMQANEKLLDMAMSALELPRDPKEMKALSGTIAQCVQLIRDSSGLLTPLQAQQMQIARERVEIERRKADSMLPGEDGEDTGVILMPAVRDSRPEEEGAPE